MWCSVLPVLRGLQMDVCRGKADFWQGLFSACPEGSRLPGKCCRITQPRAFCLSSPRKCQVPGGKLGLLAQGRDIAGREGKGRDETFADVSEAGKRKYDCTRGREKSSALWAVVFAEQLTATLLMECCNTRTWPWRGDRELKFLKQEKKKKKKINNPPVKPGPAAQGMGYPQRFVILCFWCVPSKTAGSLTGRIASVPEAGCMAALAAPPLVPSFPGGPLQRDEGLGTSAGY